MEYLLVAGLIILVILPSVYIFYSYSQRSNEEIAQGQVNQFGTQIIDAAEEIYYLGGPSKTTLELRMPEGVKGMEIWRNQELVFFLNDGSEIAFKSRVNITSDMICIGRCYYNFTKRFYSPGIKKVIVKANGDNALITLEDEDEYTSPSTSTECTPEVCNGRDDDCDTETDEDFTDLGDVCSVGVGECENSGTMVCKADETDTECSASEGEPSEEVCDGKDNDCDGETDEDGVCLGGGGGCGDGSVQESEECEYPSTNNNFFCLQSPSQTCVERKVGIRDSFGNCNATCDCVLDSFNYQCVKDQCLAECDETNACPEGQSCDFQSCTCIGGCIPEQEVCYDLLDNDCDGDIDCDDSDCLFTSTTPGESADSVLVTDVSGSMNDDNKINLAKQADLLFVDTVLDITGNKIGAVSYESNVRDVEPLTDSKITLQNEINSYYANGGTCICCGINQAKDILLSSSSDNKKFMIVMTDGRATYYCNSFLDYEGSGTTGGISDPLDNQWAIDAGQNACDQGITVFTVGFGVDAYTETLKQIACDESLYYDASNTQDIIDIYEEIGQEIVTEVCITRWRGWILDPSLPCPPGEYCPEPIEPIAYPDDYEESPLIPLSPDHYS